MVTTSLLFFCSNSFAIAPSNIPIVPLYKVESRAFCHYGRWPYIGLWRTCRAGLVPYGNGGLLWSVPAAKKARGAPMLLWMKGHQQGGDLTRAPQVSGLWSPPVSLEWDPHAAHGLKCLHFQEGPETPP